MGGTIFENNSFKKIRIIAAIYLCFSIIRILCGKFLKRLGWANWICSCVIRAIVVDIAGSRFELDG